MTKKVARPEQQGAAPEPVAWISPRSLARVCLSHETQVWLYAAPDEVYSVPLYAAPIEGATEPPIPLSDYEEAKRQERLWQQAKTRPWAEPPTSEATRERPSPQTAGQDSEGLGRAISASPPETPVPQSEPLTKAGLQIRPFVVSEHLRSAEDVREFLLACLAEPFGLAEDREPFLANAIKHAINGLVAQTPAPQSEPTDWTHPLVHFDQIGAYRLLDEILRAAGDGQRAKLVPELRSKIAAFLAEPEAVAVPQSEPVAWYRYDPKGRMVLCENDGISAIPLYAAPPSSDGRAPKEQK